MNPYWEHRGYPWEYDPGPPKNRRWLRLFAETPNYRALGKQALGREKFRWHFGPMFYRGRLQDNSVKVLIIGQEGAQDESLSHRSFTGGTGARMQHFLNHIGISKSYLFLNTFVYPIHGQYGSSLKWLAQHPDSPIVQHRHEIFDYVLERNDVQLIVAVGNAAKESVVTWVKSRGGSCTLGARNISRCTASNLDPSTHIVGVKHPGGAGKGGAVTAIIKDFKRAIRQIRQWTEEDPNWLPPDSSGSRHFNEAYEYKSAAIPFRDFSYGFPTRLGRGGTSSNRKDNQRSIQIFSADGKYNGRGSSLDYKHEGGGSRRGYEQEPGDVPYEPPKISYRDFDKGPGRSFARLFMGGRPGLEWPDFNALGAKSHLSLGQGPIYRGQPNDANIIVLADQQSHDDLFTARALTGDSGQRMQGFFKAMGIVNKYIILRVLPINTLDMTRNQARKLINNPQTRKVYQAFIDKLRQRNKNVQLILTFGPLSKELINNLDTGNMSMVNLKAWNQRGARRDWENKLQTISHINYKKEITNPDFVFDGSREQIPRIDLPFGMLRWMGSSGDRGSQPIDKKTRRPSPDYFKLYMPNWAFSLQPEALSEFEQDAIDSAL